ncbi:MAG: hypothetical protein AB8F74_07730 [Saprospiraceae bacterium]
MDTTLHQEEENKKKGLVASIVLHAVLVILCILPLLTFPTPPPGQAGVLVSFGEPDVGQGEEEPGPAQIAEVIPEEVEEPQAEEELDEREVEEPKEEPNEPKKKKNKKLNTDDNSKEIALKKKKEKEKRIKDAAEKKKQDAAREAKRKADAEAKRKADAEAKKKAEFDKKKNSISDLFNNNDGQGSGSGSQGTSGTSGNAGNPDGDPNSSILDGIGKGNGAVSGFGNRGFQRPGNISGNFQEVGTVNVKVCVDGNGKVLSATPKLSGSTTQSTKLQKLAIANAKKYKFDKSDADTQCGTITYRFQLQ